MRLIGSGGQAEKHHGLRADGRIASGGTSQLVLPETTTRSHLLIMNISAGPLYVEFGCARAHCALTSGAVSSVTMDNVGFGFTLPPRVHFIGGMSGVTSTLAIAGQDTTQPVPTFAYGGGRPAKGTAVLSGTTVVSVTIDDGGKGYMCPPMVFLMNARQDPFGCADPSIGGGSGIYLAAGGGSYYLNGTVCTTDAVAIYGLTTGQAFTVMWLP